MKLRIQDNGLRLRLAQSEVTQVSQTGLVEGRAAFGPGQTLTYALQATSEVHSLTATLDDGGITVLVPEDMMREWAQSSQVGMKGAQPVSDSASMTILVEKDFKCLHGPRSRVEADAFPNPQAS